MDHYDNIQAIIDEAERAAALEVQPLDNEGRFVLLPGGRVVDLDRERFDDARARESLDRPPRLMGTVTVDDAASFVTVWDKHMMPESELWADREASTLTAIFNADGRRDEAAGDPGVPAFRDHRVVLRLRKTAQWKAWEAISGQSMRQTKAAEFIEDRSPDFVAPDGATMLEVAQSIKATKGVKFESTRRLSSGETTIEYAETIEARAGKRGSIAIPDVVKLLLQPYEGGPAYDMEARFRYRIDDGELSLAFVLSRPEDVLRDAFGAVIDAVQAGVGESPQVVYGRP